MFDKKAIRKEIITLRDSIALDSKKEMNRKIFCSLTESDIFKRANVIFSFVSFGSEVDTKELIEYALGIGKIICVPRVISMKEGMEIRKIESLEQLKTGFYGVLEPNEACELINREELDIVIMPGVAFDRFGGRIGYGGGFYDRFLADSTIEIYKVALAYDIQVIDRIKTSQFDINTDMLITEKEILNFTNNDI